MTGILNGQREVADTVFGLAHRFDTSAAVRLNLLIGDTIAKFPRSATQV